MKAASRFEDLHAWQRARVLVRHTYRISRTGKLAKDRSLREQLCRAAVSCMSNIAEGFARNSNRQFAHFLDITRGSAAEVQSLLYVAMDEDILTKEQFNRLYAAADEVAALSTGLVKHLRRHPA